MYSNAKMEFGETLMSVFIRSRTNEAFTDSNIAKLNIA